MKHRLLAVRDACLSRAATLLEHRTGQVTAAIVTLLLGGVSGAFAVANLGPDASDLPVSQLVESVEPLPLAAQIEALDLHALRLYRTDTLRSTDTVESLFARLGLSDAAAAAFLRKDPIFSSKLMRGAGRLVTAEANAQQGLEKLSIRWAPNADGSFQRFVVERQASGQLHARVEIAPLTASVRLGSGTISSSLFAATDDARIPDEVANQLVDILGGRIDFHRSLQRGDRFNVVYETLEADGEPLRTGRVLSVEFVNNGKTHTAVWFQQPGQKGAYYSAEGNSLSTAYLSSPVAFSRVTSGFATRMHPILQRMHRHNGVDYAAPTGTPVRVVADGVVETAGRQGGYGNVIIVKHNGSDSTLYAHLSKIDVRPGQRVTQGQSIGAVGATGWATGPHLHFEFRVNGSYQNPQVMAERSAPGVALSAQARPAFEQAVAEMRMKLSAAASVAAVASAE